MKKVLKVILIVAALVVVLSSCTQHLCPAYTQGNANNQVEGTNG